MRELVIAGQVSSIVWQSIKYQVLSGKAKTFGCVAFPNRKSFIFDNKLDFSGIKLAES